MTNEEQIKVDKRANQYIATHQLSPRTVFVKKDVKSGRIYIEDFPGSECYIHKPEKAGRFDLSYAPDGFSSEFVYGFYEFSSDDAKLCYSDTDKKFLCQLDGLIEEQQRVRSERLDEHVSSCLEKNGQGFLVGEYFHRVLGPYHGCERFYDSLKDDDFKAKFGGCIPCYFPGHDDEFLLRESARGFLVDEQYSRNELWEVSNMAYGENSDGETVRRPRYSFRIDFDKSDVLYFKRRDGSIRAMRSEDFSKEQEEYFKKELI